MTDPGYGGMISLVRNGYDRPLVVLRTFTKIYGLTSPRIGYAIAAPELIDQLMLACQAWDVGRLAQTAALAALQDQAFVSRMAAANRAERENLYQGLLAIGCEVVPFEANFLYFRAPGRDASAVRAALECRGILIGAPDDHNRVSVGTSEQNQKFLTALQEILGEE